LVVFIFLKWLSEAKLKARTLASRQKSENIKASLRSAILENFKRQFFNSRTKLLAQLNDLASFLQVQNNEIFF